MLWCILVVRRKNCIGDLSFFDVFWKKDISLPHKLVIFFKLWSIWVKYDFRHLLDDKKAWNTFLWTFCKKSQVQFMHFMLYASFLLFCAQRKSRKVCVVIISDLKKQQNNCFCLNFITFVGKNLIDFKILVHSVAEWKKSWISDYYCIMFQTKTNFCLQSNLIRVNRS